MRVLDTDVGARRLLEEELRQVVHEQRALRRPLQPLTVGALRLVRVALRLLVPGAARVPGMLRILPLAGAVPFLLAALAVLVPQRLRDQRPVQRVRAEARLDPGQRLGA